MAYIVMTYIVMAYVVIALQWKTTLPLPPVPVPSSSQCSYGGGHWTYRYGMSSLVLLWPGPRASDAPTPVYVHMYRHAMEPWNSFSAEADVSFACR